jgi:single-stranded-DNA-specific exonuclease
LPAHTVAYAEEVGQAHVRARLRAGDGTGVNAIAFRAAGQPLGQALLANRGRPLHVAGALTLDRWQGEQHVQLRIVDAAEADLSVR